MLRRPKHSKNKVVAPKEEEKVVSPTPRPFCSLRKSTCWPSNWM